ncbi:MAG: adenylylsulfate reductase, thioredoxin dependent [Chitinophagaceae bacterium]|nr:adenylylsulfate reductase, thioredoxin dependent [Chitinophagaceae bacterium]
MITVQDLTYRLQDKDIPSQLQTLTELFAGQVSFSSSFGQEDQVLTDIIFRNQLPVNIFTIDTGRLFQETYDVMDKTTARYHQTIQTYFPERNDVERLVKEKGFNSFYESVDNRIECCQVRKVKPLERALQNVKVWVTGLRADQSQNRKTIPLVEWIEDKQLFKFNPLLNWSLDAVITYLDEFKVPYNLLHDKGFISIGCAPCTRAIEPGEDLRAGRWWWESSKKECGLHK